MLKRPSLTVRFSIRKDKKQTLTRNQGFLLLKIVSDVIKKKFFFVFVDYQSVSFVLDHLFKQGIVNILYFSYFMIQEDKLVFL